MVDKGCVDPGAALVVDAKVIELRVTAEKVASFVVHHQLLNEFAFLQNVQMQTHGWLPSPERKGF